MRKHPTGSLFSQSVGYNDLVGCWYVFVDLYEIEVNFFVIGLLIYPNEVVGFVASPLGFVDDGVAGGSPDLWGAREYP